MSWNPLSVFETVSKAAEKVLDTFVLNKNDRARATESMKEAVLKAVVDMDKGQLAVNKVEAAHRSIWVAGWRPAVGWVCAAGLAWAFVLRPIVESIMIAFDVDTKLLPVIQLEELKEILKGMLGLGVLRTYEKYKGVTK